jgi:adenylate kinase family enzyme
MGGFRIHVTGASGSGVDALGRELAARLGCRMLDTDDYYWLPTDPPCTEKRTAAECLRRLERDVDRAGASWVLAGSIGVWGRTLVPHFTHVVLVEAPAQIRQQRLKEREAARFGGLKKPGGDLTHRTTNSLVWAAGYETGERSGRNGNGHAAWLPDLACPVFAVDGSEASGPLAARILMQAGA